LDARAPALRVVPVDAAHPAGATLERAAGIIRGGGLVAFPTETVYGLGADAMNVKAVGRIFAAKGRPATNPLIVHLHEAEAAKVLAREWPTAAVLLADRFWPGPLTLILRKSPSVPDAVTAGLSTVALRVPAHPVARALLRAAEIPVAAPSANPYMAVSPTTAAHVAEGLGDAVDMILDGGPTPVGIESTVVDLSGESPRLLRPGSISREEIEVLIGPLGTAPPRTAGAPSPSPGMSRRHYSPRARLVLLGDAAPDVAEGAGAVLHSDRRIQARHVIRLPGEPEGYARGLYAALHELDRRGCPVVYLEPVPDAPAWEGVRDRLARAASPK